MKCETCAHALFDKLYGEYKCSKSQLIVYDPANAEDCLEYKEGAPKTSKQHEEEYEEFFGECTDA